MINRYRTFTKIILVSFLLAVIAAAPAKAQLEEIEAFLNAGSENATALTKAYLKPLPTGLSTSLNSGWTTKAAPTKTLGFSLQLRIAAAVVPNSVQTFDANDIGLTNDITVTGTSSNTIAGKEGSGQTLNFIGGSLTIPGGTGFSYVPAPMIQANLGLIKSTDITVRYIPEVSSSKYGDLSLLGAGLKHDLTQWIPGGKLLPVDISVMGAFTSINLNANLAFNTGATDQKVETTTNTFVLNALVGKTLPFVSAYAGVGFQKGTFELDMLGDYTIGSGPFAGTISDPVSYSEDSEASFHALAGAQFKLGPVRIYAEATAAEYLTGNIGIGIGLRN